MTRRLPLLGAGLALTTALGLAGCGDGGQQATFFHDRDVPSGSFQLVAFDSCDTALNGLRSAARAVVGPYGFGGMAFAADAGMARDMAPGAPPMAAGSSGEKSSTGGVPNYSGTNTHEAGVDEPDLVKTDGRRIVTISNGELRVVDAGTKTFAGRLRFSEDDSLKYAPGDLLLSGDHALVLLREQYAWRGGMAIEDRIGAPPPAGPSVGPNDITGPRLLLIDLAGAPKLLGTYTMDGSLVDARQVGGVARVVVRSAPRLAFPYDEKKTDPQRIADNKKIIDRAGPDEWLPRFTVTAGGHTERGRVDCSRVHRPATYTGASMLTVLTFDLDADRLGRGDGVTIVADGDTVYSNGPSLYIASDQRWQLNRAGIAPQPQPARTEIYKFATEAGERPRFLGGGSVPGYLINQYAMSEWDGKLRVATTTFSGNGQTRSESGVYVLAPNKRQLVEIGHVGGLGKGERIYAVRFTGPLGYVVTFRQTDPLYTVDLSDPTEPAVRGELKINGYSAYLHPAGGTRLIGIGQEGTDQGRRLGTQVSLFDVADPANPRRLAQYHLSGANSEAEFDPHAFLYWPEDGLLVVPLQVYTGGAPSIGALVLKVTESGIDEIGFVTHPASAFNPQYPSQIRRSLVIDGTLWTVSDGGLMASYPNSLARAAWLPF